MAVARLEIRTPAPRCLVEIAGEGNPDAHAKMALVGAGRAIRHVRLTGRTSTI